MVNKNQAPTVFFSVVPFLSFIIILAYILAWFEYTPYLGFQFDPSTGEVLNIFSDNQNTSLKKGDIIQAVDGISWQDMVQDHYHPRFPNYQPGKTVQLTISGESEPIEWVYSGRTWAELEHRLFNNWWFGLIFLFTGTITYLIVRPKNNRWLLFIAFNYLTAIWLTIGAGPSHYHIWGSNLVSRIAVWLSIPILIHLHWVFPKPILSYKPWHKFIKYGAYLLSFLHIIGELLLIVPARAYQYGFLAALIVSLLFISLHYFLQQDQRPTVIILFRFSLIAILPIFIISLAQQILHFNN